MLFKNFRNTLKLLSTAEKKNYIYISFFTLFSNFFEIISIGSIPIYISFIFDPSIIQKYLNKLDIEILYNYFERDFFDYLCFYHFDRNFFYKKYNNMLALLF